MNSTSLRRVESWPYWVATLGMALLAVLGNHFGITLIFGVEVIFGSIASLLALVLLGPTAGIFATVCAALYNWYDWNHPYAAIVLVGEVFFLALTWKRFFKGNLALAAGTYWVFLGIPQVFLYYRYGLEADTTAIQLAAVKQAINEITNAILASIIFSYWPLLRRFAGHRESRITVFQSIFNALVAATLIPALVLITIDAREAFTNVNEDIRQRLTTLVTGISLSVEKWRDQHIKALTTMADMANAKFPQNTSEMQSILDANLRNWPDFLGIFVTNDQGKTIAFAPLVNAKGESTLGLSFADRPYFQAVRDGHQGIHVSEVFMGRGGVFEPIFNLTSAMKMRNQFAGIISGSLNLRQMQQILNQVPGESGYLATVIDRNGNVIASNAPELKSMVPYQSSASGDIEDVEESFFNRWPRATENITPMERWKLSSIGRKIQIPGPGQWQLIVETPVSGTQSQLYRIYVRDLSLLLGLSLLTILASHGLAFLIAGPLAKLSDETTNLPQRLEKNTQIRWPKSYLTEVDSLIENFRQTMMALKDRFDALEASQTQLKAAKVQAENASQLKSSFLANMSHEIRTPLGVILGFSDLLSEDDLPADERQQIIEGLKRNGQQLSLIIDDILDLSKVEAGFLNIERIEFPLRPLLEQVIGDHQLKAQKKKIQLELQVGPGDDSLFSDPTRLRQVLGNLIGNAVKFTHQGKVVLRADLQPESVVIEVEDSGIGIAIDDQGKLFQPFTQADSSTTRQYGGTGLGLVLSKRLSQLLGGDLRLLSSTPQKGSIFELQIRRKI